MTGVEVVGLLLGAFPLCVSAMEHYEEMRTVAGTFKKIKRVHRKDLGKIKNCQLLFKLNLKELLLPLLNEEVVSEVEYELLLLHPGGPVWKNHHVEIPLKERLRECHDRYIEILGDMQETLTELCQSTKVDDVQFQEVLNQRRFARGTQDQAQQARDEIFRKANRQIVYQVKRTQYSFTRSRRDEILAELEAQNRMLQEILAANDRTAAMIPNSKPPISKKFNPKSVKFWRHANDIYTILKATWHCTCRSCLNLWLQHYTTGPAQMNLIVPYCRGQRALSVRVSDTPPSFRLVAPRKPKADKKITQLQLSSTCAISHNNTSLGPSATIAKQRTSTVTYAAQSFPGSQTHSTQPPVQTPNPCLEIDGLCCVLSCLTATPDCFGTMLEGEHEYGLYPSPERVFIADGTSLADLLKPDSPIRLTRVQRYGIALTLASSHLQLHSTPWLRDSWTSEHVLFPTIQTNVAVLHGNPYILANVDSNPTTSQSPTNDRSFSTLGIVLLELCFGSRLEDHREWQKPGYAPLMQDSNIRQAVSCVWLEDVEGEAGEDYATAVNWTLRQAPAVLKDEKWREEFAQNVVQPLQRNFEHLQPNKSS